MSTEEQQHDTAYFNEKEFQAVFLLDPDIREEVPGQYSHLDKNLAITNLRHSKKEGINEPDEARHILQALHVLNNRKYFRKESRLVPTGETTDVEAKDGSIIRRPLFVEKVVDVSIFPKTYHALKSQFISFVNTSASRQGHRIRAATTTRREKSETFEDASKIASPWGGSKQRK